MGATFSSMAGGSGETTEMIMERNDEYDSLAAKYRTKLKALDEQATGLMKSLDSIFATAELIQFNLEKKADDADYNVKENIESCKGLVLKLLLTTENMVLHHKAASTTAISDFIHFVNANVRKQLEYIPAKFDSDDFDELVLDKYATEKVASNTCEENKYFNEVIGKNEQLEKEVEKLTKAKNRFDHIEETFYVEKKIWTKQNGQLERDITELKATIQLKENKIDNTRSSLESKDIEISDLKILVEKRNTEIGQLKAEAERQKLHSQLMEKDRRELQSSGQINERNIHSLEESIETKRSLIESLETTNNVLSSSIEELESDVRKLKASGEQLKSEVESLKADKHALRCEVHEKDEKLSELKVMNEKQNQLNQLKDTDIKNLKDTVLTREQTIKKKTYEISQLNLSLHDIISERNASQKNEDLLQESLNLLTAQKEEVELKKNELMISVKEIESERDGLHADNKTCNKTIASLQNKLDEQRKKTEAVETSYKKAVENETENKTKMLELEDALKELKNENKSLKEKYAEDTNLWYLEKLKIESELRNSTSSLRNKEEELRKTTSRFESESKQMLERHRAECDRLNANVKKKESDFNEKANLMEADIKTYKQKIKDLQDQLYNTQCDLGANISELNTAKHESASLHKQLEGLESKYTSMAKENEMYINHLKDQLRDSDFEYAKEKDAREKGDLQQMILKTKLRNAEGRLRDTEEELRVMKLKTVKQVQVYVPSRGDLISNIEEKLTALLKREMESDKKALHFVQCAKSSDIKPNIPVLLLCITVSRIGTDVQNVIHGLSLSSKMAVVIFHHKDIHALPNQGSDRVLTGQELKPLGGIFDMAFLSDKGIYECPMNRNNVINLKNFLDREGLEENVR